MIPVLIVPVLNRYDLLIGMLDSIDTFVDVLFIIDNGGQLVREDIDAEFANRVVVVDCGHNLGVAASWNLGIMANVDAPWWFFVGADTKFAPGDLGYLAAMMNDAEGPLAASLLSFGAFAVNEDAIAKVGFFDTNYIPVYCEDADWSWRARQAGVRLVPVEGGTIHVEGGSAAIKVDGTGNQRTYPQNVAYHREKWGGDPWHEVFTTPFDSGADVSMTFTPPLVRLRALKW